MSTIGGRTVDVFNGQMMPGELRTRVEIYERPGVDGHGALILPLKADQVDVRTIRDLATSGDQSTESATYLAMIGTEVTVVDQWGVTWANTLVVDCVIRWSRTLSAWRVEATWTFLPS